LHAVTEDAQQLRLDFLHTLDDHGQISDSDGEEDEDDVDYDDYEEHEAWDEGATAGEYDADDI
jgi:hypothetical protein